MFLESCWYHLVSFQGTIGCVQGKEGRPRAALLTQSAAIASTSSLLGLRMTISAPLSGR